MPSPPRCLIFSGKPAADVFCRCLTNQNWQVRQFGVSQLPWMFDDSEEYLIKLKPSLTDPDGNVRVTAYQGVAEQTQSPELAIPILLTALTNRDDSFSAFAAKALAGFGTNALTCLPALTNAAANDKPAIANAALKTLVALSPEETLPLVFKSYESTDQSRKRHAFTLLCSYPTTNTEIQKIIEVAATNNDDIISRRAKTLITGQLRKDHPERFRIHDDPSYNGKPLSEWLKQRHDGFAFSPQAEDAIRHLGTNAIPSLLERLAYTEPPFGERAYETNAEGMGAFIVLGELGSSALPRLAELMNGPDEQRAVLAMVSSCTMGENGMLNIIGALTNKYATVRSEAVGLLTSDVGKKYPLLRQRAVPLLVQLLNDPDKSVRMNATNTLKELDAGAAVKVELK